jgi:ATP-binding cassette subfamily B protein/ATP-binding cassette subfamily C protein
MAKPKPKLSTKQYLVAIGRVCKTTYRAAPMAIIIQLIGSVMSAVLPIITTYFAAQTTTALAGAFAGDAAAGDKAILYVIITAGLGVLMTAWSSLESYVSQLMRYKVEAAIGDRMYEHFLELDFWRYDDKKTADTYDKAQQFARFFPYVFERLANIFTQIMTMIAGLVALIIVSWWLGLIAVVAIIPGVLIQFRLSRASTKHWNENVETRRAQGMIEWHVLQPQYMAELRLYGVVRYLLNLRMKLRDSDERARIDFERSYMGKRLGADVLQAVAEIVALIWVTLQIIHRAQPIGQFIYVQQVVSRAIGGASSFVSAVSSIDEDVANLYDYQAFMDLPSQHRGAHRIDSAPEKIEIRDVSFQYPTAKTKVLHHVNMTIKRGQHVAIVGENGAGKSTLIKIITGLYRPTKGEVIIDGKVLADTVPATWHQWLGVLQQDFISYGFASAKDNIFFGDTSKPFSQDRLDQALDRAEARTFIEKLPKGIDSYVNPWMEDNDGNNGTELSGGQWQRLALARNFYRDSPIIILDEPTSAIDALAESRIFQHLFADKQRTVITISHRLTTIEKADVIFMLKDGKLVEQGTHRELVAQKGEYYTMFESQLHI